MASSWRTTARMLATAAAASAVSKAVDSVRRLVEEATKLPEVSGPVSQPAPLRLVEPTSRPNIMSAPVAPVIPAVVPAAAAHTDVSHSFGPTLAPTRGVGFQNPPRSTAPAPAEPAAELPVITQPPSATLTEFENDASEPVASESAAPVEEQPPAVIAQVPVDKAAKKSSKKTIKKPEKRQKEAKLNKSVKEPGKHRRDRGAISGTVVSSRGRGLRGIEISVVDTDEVVVATAISGSAGAFIVEELPAGAYRIMGADPDGDFVAGWIGGSSFATASTFKLKDSTKRRKAKLNLVAAADIAVSVDARKKSAQLGIHVTERGTGVPATGRISVTSKLIGVELPLSEGRVDVTLFGAPDGSTRVPKKVDIDYLGDAHTAAASRSTKLR